MDIDAERMSEVETVIYDLLAHRGKKVVNEYVKRANACKTEKELRCVLRDVREAI